MRIAASLGQKIDSKDFLILQILIENGRASLRDIANRLGISDVAVRKRIKKLEDAGVIRGYTAVVDPACLGYPVTSLTGVDAEPGDLLRLAMELSEKEYVKSAWITAGDHALMLEIWARDEAEMERIVAEISAMRGVTRVCPAVVTNTLKRRC